MRSLRRATHVERTILVTLAILVTMSVQMPAQEPETETTTVADGVFRFRFRAHVGLFVVTSDGVVAFDPISAEAANHFAAAIRAAAPDARLRAVVYSHDHADHASGANVLREALGSDALIVAHENAVPPLANAGPDLPSPSVTFANRLDLHFGGRTIELHYLGPNHSDNSVVAFVPDVGVVFAVDFVSHDRVGYRDLPGFHFPEMFTALERLLELPFETIVFGHGPPGNRASVERQLGYYRALREAVAQAVEAGLSEDQAAAQVRLDAYAAWDGYDNWFPLNVRGMYRALSKR